MSETKIQQTKTKTKTHRSGCLVQRRDADCRIRMAVLSTPRGLRKNGELSHQIQEKRVEQKKKHASD